jgi:hypothetical protein
MQKEEFEKLYQKEAILFRTSDSNYDKACHLSNTIQLHIICPYEDLKKNWASDVKLFSGYYIKSLDEKEIHYDQIRIDLIFNYIDSLKNEKKVLLSKFVLKELKKFGHEDHIVFCEDKINAYEREVLLCKKNLINYLKFLFLLSKSSIGSIIISLLIIFILSALIVLPAPYKWMSLFTVQYVPVSQDSIVNHFLNVAGGLIGLFDDFKITPKNIAGFLVLFVGKILFIWFVINILLEQLNKKTN